MEKATCGQPLFWHHCYSETYDIWAPDSFAHPAKMSPALCFRILRHLRELGLLGDDSVVLDPMGGIGTTNICASAEGYRSVSVELEGKFIQFQRDNKEYAERKLFKELEWQILQGDSRNLSKILAEHGLVSITSPPYDDMHIADTTGIRGNNFRKIGTKGFPDGYGKTDGQIGNLKAVTSPPYIDAKKGEPTIEAAERMAIEMEKANPKYGKRRTRGRLKHLQKEQAGYSGDPANIGNLNDKPMTAIVSPPYQAGIGSFKAVRAEFVAWIENELATKGYIEWQGKRYTEAEWRELNYGRLDGRVMVGSPKMGTEGYNPENPHNIGNLPDEPLVAVTSPPYGIDKTSGGLNTKEPRSDADQGGRDPESPSQAGARAGYGDTEGQIGILKDKPMAAITSPPYGEALSGGGIAQYGHYSDPDLAKRIYSSENQNPEERARLDAQIERVKKGKAKMMRPDVFTSEGNKAAKGYFEGCYSHGSAEQIGNLPDNNSKERETYLDAMLQVYRELALVSDVLTIVIKNPTRGGKIRRLDLDTIKLIEMAGWKLHCQHRALLFEELEAPTLFGDTEKKVKGRMSFFKRLAWRNGKPVAAWEDVLICVK